MQTGSNLDHNQPKGTFWRRFFSIPRTKSGQASVWLAIAFFVLLALFFGLVASGQRGGETFFSNPWLAISILLAAASAIAGGGTAIAAIFWKNERSILSFASLILGLFVLWFASMEIIFPH